jgi:glutamyl-tRNA synthetase
MAEPVVTRFAPSPTGHLHVGGARTALFNWALARSQGGHFLLRIEDTDQARSSDEAARGLLEDLAWLGLLWDEGPERTGAGDDGGGGAQQSVIGGDPRGIGPFYQSERLAGYQAAIAQLLEQDLAYPAFETPEELEALRQAAQAEKRAFRYTRAPDHDPAAALARMANESHVIRFRMPNEAVEVTDAVLGPVSFGADQLDDFVLRKRDGFPTYHLAVVVDDQAMGVSHVLRGQEHLNNTPRHIALQRALGFRVPHYAHLPILFNPDGSKMSKRDRDKAARGALREALKADPEAVRRRLAEAPAGGLDWEPLERWLKDKRSQLPRDVLDRLAEGLGLELPGITVEDFREAGYLPEVVVNFLALLGWSPGEKLPDGKDLERFTPEYLGQNFSLARIGKGNARFDRTKLLAFNQESLAALPPETFVACWSEWCARYAPQLAERLDPTRRQRLATAMQPRSRTLADPTAPDGTGAFALLDDDAVVFDEKAVNKVLRKGDPSGRSLLAQVRETLASLDSFEPAAVEAAVGRFCEERGLGMGKVAQPLRVALTGGTASPPLGDTLAIVGREGSLARIDRCLAAHPPD